MEAAGVRIILLSLIISALLAPHLPALSIMLVLFAAFTAFFFRDPDREIGDGVVSPADGRVDVVEGRRLEIFMGLLDCHVNRSPCDGVVVSVEHIPGKFSPAFLKGIRNETNRITIEGEDGTYVVEQIAGFFARRIICYVKEGERVKKGQRIGMIVFGSRVTLEVPEGYRFVIREGERVKAGQTVAVRG
ncbi:phosphatidylserine decarboxylase precursor-related protein [Geoglobus ahangari]|uniref:Phosphatidylserine decarboxylase-related protein n=1 Tax=Geoglobus ahangari TaxID=113653 RepID=A0A0F7DBB5_9EURY|nr:phosphatidylserine decarboxylase [Geoglobus ahangari]AKG90801.1 phosphatidylserine decarboxylase precursor-related protein [Geoglobus ahangari]